MNVLIRRVTDLDNEWPRLWPLLQQLGEHQAPLYGRYLLADREARVLRRLKQISEEARGLLLVAEEAEHFLAVGHGSIISSRARPGTLCGDLSNVFVAPGARGRYLVHRLQEEVDDWLRSHGVRQAEGAVIAGNERTLGLWRRLGYQPFSETLRKAPLCPPVAPGNSSAGLVVSVVRDLAREWPRLLKLLGDQPGGIDAEAAVAQRARLLKLEGSSRQRILLVERRSDGEAVAMAVGRLLKNPWIMEERVGTISDIYIDPGAAPADLTLRLLNEIEAWFARKQADSAQVTVPLDWVRFWQDCGFKRNAISVRRDF